MRKPPAIPISAPSSPIASASTRTVREDLAPRGAERAQHPELGDPLGDGDREGVEDQEGADEDGDEAEDEQEGLQEAEACRGFLRSCGRRFPAPVSTRTAAGISRSIRRFSAVGETPVAAATEIWSKRPTLWVSACATGSVTWAMLAPPKEALPSWVKPTRRNSCALPLADQLDLFAELEAGAFGRRLVDRGFGRPARRGGRRRR